ncbi:TetR/AcrR family transcriptional regulator C-terminal domain-containing protein [Streptomyces sp. NPDC051684]|uniref:TetR/AcrR family transcriptional regulator C-terminal domain-containing protein n=1 Tax=Streptomyces sp. NPDC051684 TaxID=3365670 RepID=UPI00378E29AA
MALDRQRIVTEAVALLDEGGLDAVTLRKLAQRLGVQAPTLYWHIRNKAELINELAEAILEDLTTLVPPADGEPWRDWLTLVAQRMRTAMLDHPDGARIVSAAHLSPTLAAVSELAMSTLVHRGLHLRQARLTVLAVQRFIIGHVLEEQSPPPDRAALHGFDASTFAARHPTITAGITDYFQDGRTVDDLFRDSIEVILR